MTTVREFRNLHTHGFARVAACTVPVAMADPATNAARIAEQTIRAFVREHATPREVLLVCFTPEVRAAYTRALQTAD